MPIEIAPLLEPIPGDAPCGADIRYHAITDKLKEARRRDDDVALGVWKRDLKSADYPLVLKLGREALTKHSKDLQVAAWMTEALLHLEGFAGLRQGLELLRSLLETFWDGVHPQQDEDGDLELRATPLSWVGSQLNTVLHETPLLAGGVTWFDYRDSKTIPSEEQANADPEKLEARQEAIAENRTTPEAFDSAVQATSSADLHALHERLVELMEYAREFAGFCDEKFGNAAPDLNPLQRTLEEVYQVVRVLYKRKEPVEVEPEPEEEQAYEEAAADPVSDWGAETAAAAQPAPARRRAAASPSAEPTSSEDAIARVLAAAEYLRREQPGDPAGYLIGRAVRWGELRKMGRYPDMSMLEAPARETRQDLKRLSNEGQWSEVRAIAERAAGEPCGRAWLDLQRYAVTANRMNGDDAVADAILSELKALLDYFPELPSWSLNDDTPTANAETIEWLKMENVLRSEEAPASAQPAFDDWTPPPSEIEEQTESGEPRPPDAYELAMEAARSGRTAEAIDIMARELAQEGYGRARFLRKTQLAQVCLAVGNQAMAKPILQALAQEVERRALEDWEAPELISQPLALLYRCLPADDPERANLYARVCRLDPARAVGMAD